MLEDLSRAIIDGKYYWKLIFDYDNTGNTEPYRTKYKYSKKKSVSSKEIMSQTFNAKFAFTYDNKSGVTLEFEGVGEGSSNVEYNIHIETAYELVKTSETNQAIEETFEEEREYTIGGGSVGTLYQLCYLTQGVVVETDTFVTDPRSDIFVKLKFSCHRHILGLEDILNIFSHTFPGSSNVREWTHIRDSIVQNTALPALSQFKLFVTTLGGITPESSNTIEWASIRQTCQEILKGWGDTDKQLLFKKLLERFSVTRPGNENTEEWSAIRTLSDKILIGLKELPWD